MSCCRELEGAVEDDGIVCYEGVYRILCDHHSPQIKFCPFCGANLRDLVSGD